MYKNLALKNNRDCICEAVVLFEKILLYRYFKNITLYHNKTSKHG